MAFVKQDKGPCRFGYHIYDEKGTKGKIGTSMKGEKNQHNRRRDIKTIGPS